MKTIYERWTVNSEQVQEQESLLDPLQQNRTLTDTEDKSTPE